MRKRLTAAVLALVMTLSMLPAALAAGTVQAMPTNDKLTVDGALQNPTVYKINGSNYFKIRDLAAILNGTSKQFGVGYDNAAQSVTATTGQGYAKLDTDLAGAPAGGNKTAARSNDAIYVNGVRTEAEVYKIDGSNYFKLRDLGDALGFAVDWNKEQGMLIDTAKTVTPAEKTPLEQIQGIWYGQEDDITTEIIIEGSHITSTVFDGTNYENTLAVIDKVEIKSDTDEYVLHLVDIEFCRVDITLNTVYGVGFVELETNYKFALTPQAVGLTRTTAQQLYPQYQAALTAAQKPSEPEKPSAGSGIPSNIAGVVSASAPTEVLNGSASKYQLNSIYLNYMLLTRSTANSKISYAKTYISSGSRAWERYMKYVAEGKGKSLIALEYETKAIEDNAQMMKYLREAQPYLDAIIFGASLCPDVFADVSKRANTASNDLHHLAMSPDMSIAAIRLITLQGDMELLQKSIDSVKAKIDAMP